MWRGRRLKRPVVPSDLVQRFFEVFLFLLMFRDSVSVSPVQFFVIKAIRIVYNKSMSRNFLCLLGNLKHFGILKVHQDNLDMSDRCLKVWFIAVWFFVHRMA